jgi:metal transporter CNNM
MDIALSTFAFILLVIFSALCSGLNIGLMSLDVNDLKRKAKLNNPYAKKILPLRQKGHLSLASILLCNVAAISAASLLLGSYMTGVLAGSISTILIVIFGEITPQAVFSNNALRLTARFMPLLYIMIVFTYPLARPIQLLLDKLFPSTHKSLHNRDELGIIVSEHIGQRASDLDEDEVEIIRGALQLSEKRVRDIMKPIEDVYWLTPDTFIDAHKIDEIKDRSHSRIPIFNRRLTKSYGILLMKELIDINFDEEPVRVNDLPLYPTQIVGSMTALDTMFRKFIASRTHLIPIEKEDQIIGIVTIEDLIEEILGHEIEDETDRRSTTARSANTE